MGLRREHQAIEQQSFLRVFALSRTDSHRERVLVPPRGYAFLHWQSIPQWRVWTFSLSPFLLNLVSFLLIMCIDAPESTSNSRSSGLFEVGASITLASIGV